MNSIESVKVGDILLYNNKYRYKVTQNSGKSRMILSILALDEDLGCTELEYRFTPLDFTERLWQKWPINNLFTDAEYEELLV